MIKFRIWFKWLVLYWKHAAGVPLKCFQKQAKVNSRMVQISLHVGVNTETLKFHWKIQKFLTLWLWPCNIHPLRKNTENHTVCLGHSFLRTCVDDFCVLCLASQMSVYRHWSVACFWGFFYSFCFLPYTI